MNDEQRDKPYIAANGHKMVMGGQWSNSRQKMVYSSAWARCTDDCAACAAGGSPSDYCGEEW